MSETGSGTPGGKSSIFSHAGLMTVIAAAISALAAVAVAYIQKGGPADKTAEAPASTAVVASGVGAPAAPVYVTKLVNGKIVRVLVPAAQAGGTGPAAADHPEAGGGGALSRDGDTGSSAREPGHSAGDAPAAAEPADDTPADNAGEGE